MTTKPYLTSSAHRIDSIQIRAINDLTIKWDYQITLGEAGYIHITAEDANDLFLILARRLYDDNTLSMDTADRIAYLCQNVIADREMPMSTTSVTGDPWLITEE